ncbi:MAG: T9SS type A sorting domain-containing protein [Flavobacteriales bacterium]
MQWIITFPAMRKILPLLFSIISLSSVAQSQFTAIYNHLKFDRIWDVEQQSDSAYIIAGTGSAQFTVAKITSEGESIWCKQYGDSAFGAEFIYGILKTLDNGFLLTGYSKSFGDGSEDMLIIKINNEGNIEWSQVLGENGMDYAYDAIQLQDSSFIICGAYTPPPGIFSSAGVARIDKAGNILWVTTAENGGFDSFIKVIKTDDDKLFLCGGHGGRSQIAKMDINGNVLWGKVIAPNWSTIATGIVGTPDKGAFVVSHSEYIGFGSSGKPDLVIYKLDSMGNVDWCKFYGNPGREFAEDAIFNEIDSTYIVAFDTDVDNDGTSKYGLAKFDIFGNLIWSKAYGGSGVDYVRSIKKATDQSLFIVGETTSFGGVKPFLVKVDNNGNGSGCYENALAIDTTGSTTNIYIVSSYNFLSTTPVLLAHSLVTDSININDSLLCYECDSADAKFGYLINNNEVSFLDSSVNITKYFWDFGDGDSSSESNPVHYYSFDGNYHVCLTAMNSCSSDSFCLSFDILITGIEPTQEIISSKNIYPNPTSGLFTISLTNLQGEVNYSIATLEGRIVKQANNITTNDIEVDLSNESKGVYLLRINETNTSKVYKIIKQ